MPWRVVFVDCSHFHAGDLMQMVRSHPLATLEGIHDPHRARATQVMVDLGIPESLYDPSLENLLDRCQPHLVVCCGAAADHARWVERIARPGQWILVEKPMAASLEDAERMVVAARRAKAHLVVNWPLAWDAAHRTAYRIAVRERRIGEIQSVHYFGGNRGPLWHTYGKAERTQQQVDQEKPSSWFYKRSSGGGSLLDYLGYGTTLGTWFLEGRLPIDLTSVTDQPADLEVDEHSITICRYPFGLSRMETRWGTFTDPWNHPTQPPCGFLLVGSEGTLRSDDYATSLVLQDAADPEGLRLGVDTLTEVDSNPIAYLLNCFERNLPVTGPLSEEISWSGQRMVETAFQSAQRGTTLPLLGGEATSRLFPKSIDR
jgi:glucose-fructose oxidoreductase